MDYVRLEDSLSFKLLLSKREAEVKEDLESLLSDRIRCDRMIKHLHGMTLDISRQLLSLENLELLLLLAEEMKVKEKKEMLFNGGILNESEGKPVLHTILRVPEESPLKVDRGVSSLVYSVLYRIRKTSEDIRAGKITASDGGPFTSILCVGIGGSFLGTAFAVDAFLGNKEARLAAKGKVIRFLSNVDPAALRAATDGLDANRTLVIIISKTFTTVETMKNAVMVRKWLIENISDPLYVGDHMYAISANYDLTREFGIEDSKVFGFWDWVGGRFSVSSAVGILPMSIYFGFEIAKEFLDGCHQMDLHFLYSDLKDNLPVLLALCSFYNSTILGLNAVAILPYSQDLNKFPSYVQQLAMESNGKSYRQNGGFMPFEAGEIYFGEVGTNGQHSFYQLLHQGRVVPAEFIGFIHNDSPDFPVVSFSGTLTLAVMQDGVTCHQELMANFFAQPDALAFGRSIERLISQGCDKGSAPHRMCEGNRPSTIILIDKLTPFSIGSLVSLYEHRTAVQGFLWGINSFDQMGVELGKVTASGIRSIFAQGGSLRSRFKGKHEISYSTTVLLQKFANPKASDT